MTFHDLGLSEALLRAIIDAGYTEPTPIQAQAIPHALAGRDILGIAQTGTGKTASFTLPMIDRLAQGRAKARMPRSLILTPTRELAAQVADNFTKYGKNHKLSMALLIGGVSFGDQDRILTAGADVLIATPGRLLDHFERGKLLLNGVQMLVIDEADRMLDMGFIPDIERIVGLTPFTRQTLFFSATMPPEIERLSQKFLSNPAVVEVARRATTAEKITQLAVKVTTSDPKTKRDALRAAIDAAAVNSGIVFCNRKRDVDIVARSLVQHGYDAAPIHGDLAQSVRTATLTRFRDGSLKLLVASDVAARGLDIPDVGGVFNFDVPRHSEDYVHRIGRTGRAGKSGVAYTIVSPEDAKSFKAVEALIGKPIELAAVTVTASANKAESAESPARSGERSGDRPSRGGRSRRRPTGSAHTTEQAPEQAETGETASQAVDAPSPTAERKPRQPRQPRQPQEARETRERPSRREPAPQPAEAVGEDHLPAFLFRSMTPD